MLRERLPAVALAAALVFGLGLLFGLVVPRLAGIHVAPKVYNTTVILKQVQTLSELVTVKYVMEKVEILEDQRSGAVGDGGHRSLLAGARRAGRSRHRLGGLDRLGRRHGSRDELGRLLALLLGG